MIGRITKVLSNDYTVRYNDGNEDICKARGVFRNKKISPLVGDIVEVDNNKKIITDIRLFMQITTDFFILLNMISPFLRAPTVVTPAPYIYFYLI